MLPYPLRALLVLLTAVALADTDNGRWTLSAFEHELARPAVWADTVLSASADGAGLALGGPQLEAARRGRLCGWSPPADSVAVLELGFPRSETRQVWVVEDQNPGAIVEISAVFDDGELLLYRRGPRAQRFLSARVLWLELAVTVSIDRLRIRVDPRRGGRTSIDAVALVEDEERARWEWNLARSSVLPGDTVELLLPRPHAQRPGQDFVVSLTGDGGPPLAWCRLTPGQRVARLVAPADPGSYHVERRDLLSEDVLRLPLTVVEAADLALGFRLAQTRLRAGQPFAVELSAAAAPRDGESYQLVIVAEGGAEQARVAVPSGARTVSLTAPSGPGRYVLRLLARGAPEGGSVIHEVQLTIDT